MSKFDNQRKKKIYELIIILKIVYLSLCTIAIFGSYNHKEDFVENAIAISVFLSITLLFILIYLYWTLRKTKNSMNSKINRNDYIEIAIFISLFLGAIYQTGLAYSGYKLLSIFVVIIVAIELGRNYSIAVASILSSIILSVVYMSLGTNKQLLSVYFETDLVLISALFVVAFILGLYVDIEKEHRKALKGLAITDELTGLFNHRYFQEKLDKHLNLAEQTKVKLSLLFMDIDFFKSYNDINGHQAGDTLLREVSNIMRCCIRGSDILARYGGEEFAVILPNTAEKDALKIGERIREAIEKHQFYGQENQPNNNVTISIGISTYPERAKTKQQLLNTADDALYRAKSFKKNRVEVYYDVLDRMCENIDISYEVTSELKSFISKINVKDRYTYGHTERVVIYSKTFADYLNLSKKDKVTLQIGAYLHDIGKLGIPEEILNKKSKLTDEEYETIKLHSCEGVKLIKNITQFKDAMPVIKHHHEKYNGYGYPDKLKGEDIPYLARILNIVDSFDAMTSNRPYNISKTYDEGIAEIKRCAGTQFDPELAEKFTDMLEQYRHKF